MMGSRRMRRVAVLVVLASGLLMACRGGKERSPAPTLEPGYVPTSVAQSLAAAATYQASLSTPAPTPTATSVPSSTPTPVIPTPAPSPTSEPTAAQPAGVVNSDGLRLRTGPGTSYAIVGVMYDGDEVVITAKAPAGDWLDVRTAEGTAGWVYSEYVDVIAGLDAIPLAAEIPPTPEPTSTPPTG